MNQYVTWSVTRYVLTGEQMHLLLRYTLLFELKSFFNCTSWKTHWAQYLNLTEIHKNRYFKSVLIKRFVGCPYKLNVSSVFITHIVRNYLFYFC